MVFYRGFVCMLWCSRSILVFFIDGGVGGVLDWWSDGWTMRTTSAERVMGEIVEIILWTFVCWGDLLDEWLMYAKVVFCGGWRELLDLDKRVSRDCWVGMLLIAWCIEDKIKCYWSENCEIWYTAGRKDCWNHIFACIAFHSLPSECFTDDVFYGEAC